MKCRRATVLDRTSSANLFLTSQLLAESERLTAVVRPLDRKKVSSMRRFSPGFHQAVDRKICSIAKGLSS